MESVQQYPVWRQVVLDTTDARGLAEFYRELLGFAYRAGDEPPDAGEPDPRGTDWLVLHSPHGGPAIAFQQVEEVSPTTWPEYGVAQQYHLDLTVPGLAELDAQHDRVVALGATLRHDRSDDPEEPLRVYADPSGHLFCIFVSG